MKLNNELKEYLNEITKYDMLTKEEEKILGERILNGDLEARQTLIKHNLRLVIMIVNKYRNASGGLSYFDLIQEGNLALMMAADKFDVSKEYKFSSYATKAIENHIVRTIFNKSRNIRLPIRVQCKIIDYKKRKNDLLKKFNRELTLEEISKELDISIKEVENFENMMDDTVSLNVHMQTSDEDGSEMLEFISDNQISIEEQVENKILNKELMNGISEILTEKELKVIILRFGLNDDKRRSLEEIARILGNSSREAIRLIEARALKKIKKRKELYVNNVKRKKEKDLNYLVSSNSTVRETLDDLKEILDEKEIQFLVLRYGLIDGKNRSIECLSKIYKLTSDRIRKMELSILFKIKDTKECKNLCLINQNLSKKIMSLENKEAVYFLKSDLIDFLLQNNFIINFKIKNLINLLWDASLKIEEAKVLIFKYYFLLDFDVINLYMKEFDIEKIKEFEKSGIEKIKNKNMYEEFLSCSNQVTKTKQKVK